MGLVAANYTYAFLRDIPMEVAMDRSFFQALAVMAVALFTPKRVSE